jgi:hypothetical protein
LVLRLKRIRLALLLVPQASLARVRLLLHIWPLRAAEVLVVLMQQTLTVQAERVVPLALPQL